MTVTGTEPVSDFRKGRSAGKGERGGRVGKGGGRGVGKGVGLHGVVREGGKEGKGMK